MGVLDGTSVILTRVVDGRAKMMRVVMAEGEDGPRRGSLAVMLRCGTVRGSETRG
jgi:hypothetical protein